MKPFAHAAIRYGADGYFGYPITPQSEVLETLAELKPWETTGMVVLQAESEVAAINMVYGGAATGKAVMTSSSSPGVSLKQEGISYLAASELPALIVNVMRGGPVWAPSSPRRPTISRPPKAAAHGDYHLIVLAPATVQEMTGFRGSGLRPCVQIPHSGHDTGRRHRRQMMEKGCASTPAPAPYRGRIAASARGPHADAADAEHRNVITSLASWIRQNGSEQSAFPGHLRRNQKNEVRFQEYYCDDAEYLIVAFGSVARICLKAIEEARAAGAYA